MLRIQEKILIHRVRQGDQNAFAKLYNEYVEQIQRFIIFKISDKEKAEDLTNTVFVKTLNYLYEKNEVENFRAFLYQAARNLVIDFYRNKKEETISLDEKITEEKKDFIDLGQKIDDNIVLVKISEAFKKISDLSQELITWRFIEGLSFKEISKITGEKEGTLRVKAHRAIQELKKIVGNE